MPLIPLLSLILPTLVHVAENVFSPKMPPAPDAVPEKLGEQKKDFVMSILHALYKKFLAGTLPDIPGIDEEDVFCNVASLLIDAVVKKEFH